MHPMERLRYVARASAVSPAVAVRETAAAMSAFADDPSALVVACRRMIDRQPGTAPLWWLAARILTAADPRAEARRCADEIAADGTGDELAFALPDGARVCVLGWPEVTGDALIARGDIEVLVVDVFGDGPALCAHLARHDVDAVDVGVERLGLAVSASDLVIIEASAAGATACLAVPGSYPAAAAARHAGTPVWLVLGAGRLLPERLWAALLARTDVPDDPWRAGEEAVPLDLVDQVVRPCGVLAAAAAFAAADCPVVTELLPDRRDLD